MLRRIGIWPRKSWHGQAESCSHIMQLEATHGIISRCFRPIAATAKLRAKLAFACLENVKQRRASRMELDDPGVSAPQGDMSKGRAEDAVMRAEEGARFAEENRVRASDVMEFVLSPHALCRMFCTRIVLEQFRIVKSNMLFRDGMGGERRPWPISCSASAQWQRYFISPCDDNRVGAHTVGGLRWACCCTAFHLFSSR